MTAVDDPVPTFLHSPLGAAVGFGAGLLMVWLLFQPLAWWLDRRDRPRRQREQAERERQSAVRELLRELEQQIREEQMTDEARAWHRQYRERQAAIRREARRRLGLPEDDTP